MMTAGAEWNATVSNIDGRFTKREGIKDLCNHPSYGLRNTFRLAAHFFRSFPIISGGGFDCECTEKSAFELLYGAPSV
jgi:hypothetical protein